jgi:hypothetical protein
MCESEGQIGNPGKGEFDMRANFIKESFQSAKRRICCWHSIFTADAFISYCAGALYETSPQTAKFALA